MASSQVATFSLWPMKTDAPLATAARRCSVLVSSPTMPSGSGASPVSVASSSAAAGAAVIPATTATTFRFPRRRAASPQSAASASGMSRRWAAALYAVMVARVLRVLWPVGRWVLPGALGCCFALELSQLWHPEWLDAVRATPFGALVLGRGFIWSDLVAYAVGVGTVAAGEGLLRRR